MAKLEELGKVVSSDVLIVGGGIAGLITAIKAKEEQPDVDVLIVDKATIGFAGKTPKTGGFICLLGPKDNAEEFIDWHVKNVGAYLNDQELLEKYVKEPLGGIEQLMKWGVTVATDDQGKPDLTKSPLAPKNWSLVRVSLDMMLPLRGTARKMGVKMLNKIQVVKLLTRGNQVVGAVGFNIIDGKFYVFKAKATIIAAGDCSYKVRRMWRAAAGESLAMAYWAGAEMRNAEFGNLYAHITSKDTGAGGAFSYPRIVNARGENLLKKYVTIPGPWGYPTHPTFALGWEKEVREGRGPIVADMTIPLPPRGRALDSGRGRLPASAKFYDRQAEKLRKYWKPANPEKIELELYLHGEHSCIKVDHEMKTTLPGLWAIGDASYAGAALTGAASAPPGVTQGCGLGFAVVSALWAGPPAARYASKIATPELNYEQVKQFKEEIFAPSENKKGVPPDELIYNVQNVVCPMKYNMRRHEDRLKEGLSMINEIKQKVPNLYAKDFHYLMLCHEAKAMAVCAELLFRAALMRTESRGWHYREDYPTRDDKNWLKWIIVKQEKGKMVFSTEPVPINKYKIKP